MYIGVDIGFPNKMFDIISELVCEIIHSSLGH